jgi:hypothetical protein
MTSEQFCFWLQGFFAFSESSTRLDSNQVQVIKNHLNLVFAHAIVPKAGSSVQYQNYLQGIHDGQDSAGPLLRC